MKNAWIAKTSALLLPPPEPGSGLRDRSVNERFPIPFTFKPQLSFIEAVVATAGAFSRVLLGSLLFAVWGAYSLALWTAARSFVWRIGVLLPLFLLFLLSFALLMIAISALVRIISPTRS
jgi:hypothetical protein